ncbi:hypothetical protein [Microbacterium sp.]|jgi:hypothetical protein|uniref:hypothetical protein n=1 Tax=Microbacterium sp. TaxID=51671 RepID=UPI0037CA99B5
MKRIDVLYNGSLFSIGGRELADIQSEVASFRGAGGWLLVNDGEGARREAYLWLDAGVPIALVPIPGDDGD